MEEAKGLIRRVVLFKFKAETAPDHIEQLLKEYSNLVNLIEPLKSWHMGTEVIVRNLNEGLIIRNLNEGFTHAFELTFESAEGAEEYFVHPVHLEFHERCCPHVEKAVGVEYNLTPFRT